MCNTIEVVVTRILAFVFYNPRQGEEWYRNRMAVAKKTLRPKEIIDFIPAMNRVGTDFVERMKRLLTPDLHVPNLEQELFKWAFECKVPTKIRQLYTLHNVNE